MQKKETRREAGQEFDCNDENSSRNLKWIRGAEVLATGARITRFDAEKFGDHCLNTTISVLGKKGLVISRESIVIEGRYGKFRCNAYWLEPDQIERARQLLGVNS